MIDASTTDAGKRGRSPGPDRRPYAIADPDGRTIIDQHGRTFGFADDAGIAAVFVEALNAVAPEEALLQSVEPGGRYRVGRSLGRTIYRQVGIEASKSDVFIGVIDTRRDAAMLAGALNLHDAGPDGVWQVPVRRTIEGTVTVEADTAAAAVRAAESMSHTKFAEAVKTTADVVDTGVAQPVER